MKEVTGNLWTYPADFIVITTNGTVRADGSCVMGRGCAREAKEKFPGLAKKLGARIKKGGNHVEYFDQDDLGYVAEPTGLYTFPVKHHWYEQADLDLIRQSVGELGRLVLGFGTYVMPRPGCGNGQRTWEEVRPLLLDLPDNVHVIDFDRSTQA
jgi:hypothetical protein